jgi:hypothetical protein
MKTKKRIIYSNRKTLIVVFCIMISFGFSFSFSSNQQQNLEFKKVPKTSGSQTVPYGYFLGAHAYAADRIEWSFESSKSHIGITVLVMDYDNYNTYKDYGFGTYGTASNGSLSNDSGSYQVPYGNEWYILFVNKDSDNEATVVSYSVRFDPSPFTFQLTFILIIGGVVIGSIVGLVVTVLVIRRRHKRKRELEFVPEL